MKPAEVRFYFDEDILGLGRIVAGIRNDCTHPGDPGARIHKRDRPACPIATGTKDTEWLPRAADEGWIVISRDLNIRENPAERRAVRETGVRMVALSGQDARGTWAQLELFMRRWRRIEALTSESGPFIYLASTSRFVPVSLND